MNFSAARSRSASAFFRALSDSGFCACAQCSRFYDLKGYKGVLCTFQLPLKAPGIQYLAGNACIIRCAEHLTSSSPFMRSAGSISVSGSAAARHNARPALGLAVRAAWKTACMHAMWMYATSVGVLRQEHSMILIMSRGIPGTSVMQSAHLSPGSALCQQKAVPLEVPRRQPRYLRKNQESPWPQPINCSSEQGAKSTAVPVAWNIPHKITCVCPCISKRGKGMPISCWQQILAWTYAIM